MKLGKLRRDESCHWYLIPWDKIEAFDKLSIDMEEVGHMEAAYDDLEDEFIEKFEEYMLGGGVGHLDVIIPE